MESSAYPGNFKHPSFTVGDIQFKTKNKNYSFLVTHIPNDLASTSKGDAFCRGTDDVIQEYAKSITDRAVVGYIGDTNYAKMMRPFSSLSVGGNEGPHTLIQDSSGSKDFTYFMQAIPCSEDIPMNQPSALNTVKLEGLINNNGKQVSTDHPSMQASVLLDEVIEGRGSTPQNNQISNEPNFLDYYGDNEMIEETSSNSDSELLSMKDKDHSHQPTQNHDDSNIIQCKNLKSALAHFKLNKKIELDKESAKESDMDLEDEGSKKCHPY